jgi:hypothetical protein
MDIAAIQTTLVGWAGSVLGLPSSWENQIGSVLQVKMPAVVIFTGPMNIVEVGTDETLWDTTGGSAAPTIVGQRQFDVMIRVVSRSQAGNKTGAFFLEKLCTALKRPSTLQLFDEAGIAVLYRGTIACFDAPFEERFESIASVTLRVTAVVVDADDAPISTLTSVDLTTRIESADGTLLPSPPNVTHEIVGS